MACTFVDIQMFAHFTRINASPENFAQWEVGGGGGGASFTVPLLPARLFQYRSPGTCDPTIKLTLDKIVRQAKKMVSPESLPE